MFAFQFAVAAALVLLPCVAHWVDPRPPQHRQPNGGTVGPSLTSPAKGGQTSMALPSRGSLGEAFERAAEDGKSEESESHSERTYGGVTKELLPTSAVNVALFDWMTEEGFIIFMAFYMILLMIIIYMEVYKSGEYAP